MLRAMLRGTAALFAAVFTALFAALIPCGAAAQPFVEEVPFITSPDNVTLEMLRLADVKPGDHVIDLGSGDGRIVILAARRFGATGLGVEIDPELVRKSIAGAQAAGVAGRVSFRVEDLFTTDLSRATVVTMYLLPEFNLRLRPSLLALKPGTRIVSHDWDMGDWPPDRSTQVDVPDKQVGRDKSSRIHLWVVPARVEGVWCGTGGMQGATLRVSQRYQRFEATLAQAGGSEPVSGRVDGETLRPDAGARLPFLRAAGERMELLPPGSGGFTRAAAGSC
jgi:SAM-dependent methyltransferase